MTTRHDNNELFRLVEAAVDGELAESELSELRGAMAENEELRLLETALLEMRELVQTEVQVAADSVDFDNLWSRIEAELPAGTEAVDALTLQAYADGELSPSEAHRVAGHLAQSEGARSRLEAISEMGGLLRVDVETAAEAADFSALWSRLESEVGDELEARGGFGEPEVHEAPRPSWFERFVGVLGGYRSVAMSVATAAVAILVMFSVMNGGESDDEIAESSRQDLEIRVVHINEVRSDPGYNVTVDNPNGTAPVIYIRPTDSTVPGPEPVEVREQDNGLFVDPI